MARRSKAENEREFARREGVALQARLALPEVQEILGRIQQQAIRLYQKGERDFEVNGASVFSVDQAACSQYGVYPWVWTRPNAPPTIQPILTTSARAALQAVHPFGDPEDGRHIKLRVDMHAARSDRDAGFGFWMDTFERFPIGLDRAESKRRTASQEELETLRMLQRLVAGESAASIARTYRQNRTTIIRRVRRLCANYSLRYPGNVPRRERSLDVLQLSPDELARCEVCKDKTAAVCATCPWVQRLAQSDELEPQLRERLSRR